MRQSRAFVIELFVYIANSKPTMKILQKFIPHLASKWYELGTELLDEGKEHELDIIESNHKKDVKKCCIEVFRLWLNTHTDTSWYKIMEALKSPCIELASVAADLEKELTTGQYKNDLCNILCCYISRAHAK